MTPSGDKVEKRGLSPRGIGLLAIGGGLLAVLTGVWLPLHQAATHADSVSVSIKMALCAPLLLVLGVLYAAAPKWTVRVFGMPQQKKKTIWLLHVPLLVLGWLLYSAVKARISAYGYHF